MKAFILQSNYNSSIIYNNEDLLKRQLRLLTKFGIKDICFLYKNNIIDEYCKKYNVHYTFTDILNINIDEDVILLSGNSIFSEVVFK